MKKRSVHKQSMLVGLVVGAGMAGVAAFALASGGESNAQNTLTCANTVGDPVVNVTEKVRNDADSGVAGNYWALDTLERHITVWKTQTSGTFCAVVRDEGSFAAIAGQKSPGNTGTLSGNERGDINGGYVATITGSLLASPKWQTKGDVGTVDYQCDQNGNCPGYVSWLGQYFASGFGFDQPSWGWTYRGGKYGTWINASTGTSGDILPSTKGKDGKGDGSDQGHKGPRD